MLFRGGVNVQFFHDFFVALEHFYRVPALLLFGQIVDYRFFDVGKRVFDRAGEGVLRNSFRRFCRFDRRLRRFLDAVAFKCRNLHYFAAHMARKFADVYFIAVLFYDVHHVYGHYDGDAQFSELRGEVEVALEVGAVDNVEDRVRTLFDQVVSGYDFFEGVRGQ